MLTADKVIAALSRRTGDGKTLVIKASAYVLRGVTLLLTPSVMLTGFMYNE